MCWYTLALPTGIWTCSPPAKSEPVWSLRMNVYFGPSQTSANPVWLFSADVSDGSTATPPSLLTTNENRSVIAARSCVPKNMMLPPWKSA